MRATKTQRMKSIGLFHEARRAGWAPTLCPVLAEDFLRSKGVSIRVLPSGPRYSLAALCLAIQTGDFRDVVLTSAAPADTLNMSARNENPRRFTMNEYKVTAHRIPTASVLDDLNNAVLDIMRATNEMITRAQGIQKRLADGGTIHGHMVEAREAGDLRAAHASYASASHTASLLGVPDEVITEIVKAAQAGTWVSIKVDEATAETTGTWTE